MAGERPHPMREAPQRHSTVPLYFVPLWRSISSTGKRQVAAHGLHRLTRRHPIGVAVDGFLCGVHLDAKSLRELEQDPESMFGDTGYGDSTQIDPPSGQSRIFGLRGAWRRRGEAVVCVTALPAPCAAGRNIRTRW
jgi:hypothetical protein